MDKIERGIQADAILSSPLFNEVLAALEQSYIATWKAADTVEAREDIHRYFVIIAQLKDDMRSIAMTGVLERKRQDQLAGKPTTMYAPMRKANG